jgi:hypothetical protein
MFDNNARLKSIISRKRSGRTNQFTAGTSSEHRPETKQKIAETLRNNPYTRENLERARERRKQIILQKFKQSQQYSDDFVPFGFVNDNLDDSEENNNW